MCAPVRPEAGNRGKAIHEKILNPAYRLRGWSDRPYVLEKLPERELRTLTVTDLIWLLRCDGQTEMEPEEWPGEPEWMKGTDIALPADGSRHLLPEQKYRRYGNRCFPFMELSLTGRCNMCCRHCFNAPDQQPRTAEPSLDQLKGLLAQMAECGVGELRLVGGEPLVRKDFLQVTEKMARLGIRCREIATNGFLITPELLDALESQGHFPVWNISFDGVGFHDWLRNREGAEQLTLERIRLLCKRGYYVHAHHCVWRSSLSCVRGTVLTLRDLGVSEYRILPVEPGPRWQQNAPEETISGPEWQAWFPDFLDWWYENRIPMDLDIWGYWQSQYDTGKIRIVPDISRAADRMDRIPACGDAAAMPFIDGDGRLMFCTALSGASEAWNIPWDNVYEKPLADLLTDSIFLKRLGCSCGELKERNLECHTCEWRTTCGMGCRAEALAHGSGLYDIDRRMCHFFKDGVYDRLVSLAERVRQGKD